MPTVSRVVRSSGRLLDLAESRVHLRAAEVAYVGALSDAGWLSAIPVCPVYEGQDVLWLYGPLLAGHPQLGQPGGADGFCIAVSESRAPPAELHLAFRPAAVYTSVVAYGRLEPVADPTAKVWFLKQMRRRPGPSAWLCDEGFNPFGPGSSVWRMSIERLAGRYTRESRWPLSP